MVFSSLQFIFIFMPIFFGCYYIAPDRAKNFILLIGSLCFYFIGTLRHPEHFILFILSIAADFAVDIWIEKFPAYKKSLLVGGIILHIAVLAVFKYSGFVLNEICRLRPSFSTTADIVLPVGISFYTFQGISYIADVYRGTAKAQHSPLKYAVYISMFEQLIADPIVTYVSVEKGLYARQVSADHNFYWNKNGDLVIVFDKYEVAPGSMDTPEFVIPRPAIKDILKANCTFTIGG